MGQFLKTIFGGLLKTMHTLWLEVMGALFLAFALMFGIYVVQAYRRYTVDGDAFDLWMIGSAAAMSLVMFAFGVHSFWKSRKLR
jgi:hypothetical protein